MSRLLPLLLLSACAYVNPQGEFTGRDAVVGTVVRDGGEPVPVHLYKSRHEDFRSMPTATGFIGTDDGRLLAYLQLEFTDLLAAEQDGAQSIEVGDPEDIDLNSTYGVGVSWIEHERREDGEQIFRHRFREGYVGDSTGELVLDDTDWTTFFEGQLTATLDNEEYGQRELDLAISWQTLDAE